MFYETLGNTAVYDTSGMPTGCVPPDYCLTNTGPFSNLQSYIYWSATEYAPYNTIGAWYFDFSQGIQRDYDKPFSGQAWAVHSDDVGTAVVPNPAAVWLFGSGLAGLIGIARRRQTASRYRRPPGRLSLVAPSPASPDRRWSRTGGIGPRSLGCQPSTAIVAGGVCRTVPTVTSLEDYADKQRALVHV